MELIFLKHAVKKQEARRKNGKSLHNSSLDIGTYDVADLANEDDPIDIVTAFQNHYFWPDIHQACREIRRVLKPCGWFILTGDLYKMKYHLAKYQLIEEYPELLKSEKFSGIEVFTFHGFMLGY